MPRKARQYNETIEECNNKWTVALYIRLSVEDGDDKVESNSVSNQRQLLEDFIKENTELSIYDYYIDDGYSGTSSDRPDFQRLLTDMKLKKFNTIIVKDLSRLGRNYIEVGNYIEQIFPLFNMRFIAVNDSIDSYKDPKSVNNVIVPFKNLMNDEYCRDISNKIRAILNVKKRNGEYVSALTPYGYKKDPNDVHHLIIDEEPAQVVREIFDLVIKGYGRTKIAKELNARGILNPMGYRNKVLNQNFKLKRPNDEKFAYLWDPATILSILKNQVYCGDVIQSKGKLISYKVHKHIKNPKEEWIIVKNMHEPIIDREIFEKVQKALLDRDVKANQDGTLSIYAGHLKCADCKMSMTKRVGSKYKGKPRPHYHYACSTYCRKSKDLCTKHLIRDDVLYEAILKAVKLQISLVIDIDTIIKETTNTKQVDFRKESLKNSIKKQEIEYEKQRKLKKSCYEDWKLGVIDETDYYEYNQSYVKKMQKLEEQILYLKEELIECESLKSNNEWIEKFKKYENITELSRNIMDDLIDNIYVHEDNKITIKFNYEDEYKTAIEYVKAHNGIEISSVG